MSLYLYQCSPTRPGTAPGAETCARWGRITLPLQPVLPLRPLTGLCRRPVTCAPPAAATAGCICHCPAGPPARARPRRFKYADQGRQGGGGREREGEEGGRERSVERRWGGGSPDTGHRGLGVRVLGSHPPHPLLQPLPPARHRHPLQLARRELVAFSSRVVIAPLSGRKEP